MVAAVERSRDALSEALKTWVFAASKAMLRGSAKLRDGTSVETVAPLGKVAVLPCPEESIADPDASSNSQSAMGGGSRGGGKEWGRGGGGGGGGGATEELPNSCTP